MLATEYAEYYNIAAQAEGESDTAFKHRVAGELRKQGRIIEAHEAQQDNRYENDMAGDGNGMVMAGIMGAAALVLYSGYGSTGASQVGDEIAAGIVASAPEKEHMSPEMVMIMLAMFG